MLILVDDVDVEKSRGQDITNLKEAIRLRVREQGIDRFTCFRFAQLKEQAKA